MKVRAMNTSESIQEVFLSSNVPGTRGPDNVVEVIGVLAAATSRVASAILPPDTTPGHDASGGTVASLTEAVMGVSAGLNAIACAIERLAVAVEYHE